MIRSYGIVLDRLQEHDIDLSLFRQSRIAQTVEQALYNRFVFAGEPAPNVADRNRRFALPGFFDRRSRLIDLPGFRQ